MEAAISAGVRTRFYGAERTKRCPHGKGLTSTSPLQTPSERGFDPELLTDLSSRIGTDYQYMITIEP